MLYLKIAFFSFRQKDILLKYFDPRIASLSQEFNLQFFQFILREFLSSHKPVPNAPLELDPDKENRIADIV